LIDIKPSLLHNDDGYLGIGIMLCWKSCHFSLG